MRSIAIRVIILSFIISITSLSAQYKFNDIIDLEISAIKSQGKSGTCWSFATTSFIESELMRMGKGDIDLSEMYTVRKVYEDKAFNYIMRSGKANFSQGSLAHDMIRTINASGVVPDIEYSGLDAGEKVYKHDEMEKGLKGFLDGILKAKKPSRKWMLAYRAILDIYLGQDIERFTIDDMKFTPKSYAKFLGLDSENYISITSFTHHPFNSSFVLEIPDNYSNGSFYNLKLDDMMKTIDYALEKGYSVAWDGDVSEPGFSGQKGIAVIAMDTEADDIFSKPVHEVNVTQGSRQDAFWNKTTTDDHLMHIIGKAKDQKGTIYYIIKNSWGDIGPYQGRMYMSEAYVRMKTVSILLHKDGIPRKMIR